MLDAVFAILGLNGNILAPTLKTVLYTLFFPIEVQKTVDQVGLKGN